MARALIITIAVAAAGCATAAKTAAPGQPGQGARVALIVGGASYAAVRDIIGGRFAGGTSRRSGLADRAFGVDYGEGSGPSPVPTGIRLALETFAGELASGARKAP
ncbi:MAG: hypothetical protein NT080_02915 [Spirochaetes bacterium]|nr:hypothetical protein [Spirochaetota bacterium]